MSGWSYDDGQYPSCSYNPDPEPHHPGQNQQQPTQSQPPAPAQPSALPEKPSPFLIPSADAAPSNKGSNPRESRNRAEKQRRDRMSQSIARLISILPPLAGSNRKIDKTSVLRLTAHYIRSHKHEVPLEQFKNTVKKRLIQKAYYTLEDYLKDKNVWTLFEPVQDIFGDTLYRAPRGPQFGMNFTKTFLKTMKGFVLTVTYKGLIVVVSPNIEEYLGYTELELLGQSFFNMIHPDDHLLLRKQLFPTSCRLTTNGELFLTKEPDAAIRAAEELKKEKRSFIVRVKKQTHIRSEPPEYITCHIEGSFRKSDSAGVFVDRVVQIGRRVRSRGNNPYASGNDIVFVGMVRPITDCFLNENKIDSLRMEYRTRHSVDGRIIQCEQRISLITGYMTHEVNGTNAMNFMHRDDVRWVIVALREMYEQRCLSGESCYRLMTKNGEFIYMRTKGNLEVNPKTQEVTSFVCLNTLVTEKEGKKLIREMKNKLSMIVKNEKPKPDIESMLTQIIGKPTIPVEDPRQLEKVICHLVMDLPSSEPDETVIKDCMKNITIPRLAIIPPKQEQIAKAIEKSYSVIKTLRNTEMNQQNLLDADFLSPFTTPPSSPEMPRQENIYNGQIYQQPTEIPQFFLDNQDFLPQFYRDCDWVMPPVPLVPPAQAAVPEHLVEQPVQTPLLRMDDQSPSAFPIGEPLFPLFQGFQNQQMLPLETVDPILPIQQVQIDQEEPILQPYQEEPLVALIQDEQPVPLIQEAQMVMPVQEAHMVMQDELSIEQLLAELPNANTGATNGEGDDMIQWLVTDRSDQNFVEAAVNCIGYDIKGNGNLRSLCTIDENSFLASVYAATRDEQFFFVILLFINQECLNQSAQQNVPREEGDLIEKNKSIIEQNINIECYPGQREINDIDIIVANESQIIFNGEENVVADLNRIENDPVQNIPEDNINQNSSAAPQEITSYDPYVFVDEEEPICSYSTFLSNRNIKRRKNEADVAVFFGRKRIKRC